MNSDEARLYVFIIWEKSRGQTQNILDDLKKKFVIREIFEVEWNKENFLDNLKRFYGQSLSDAEEKAKVCGIGSFLVIVISDSNPDLREPSKSKFSLEKDYVNLNVFESKERYRKWVGKEFSVHSSISKNETNHNLTLLFGKNAYDFERELPKEWDGSMKKLKSDLVGQKGWSNMEELLYIMNGTVDYVILRNFENMPEKFDYNDVDILADDEKLAYIVNKDFSPLTDNPRTIRFEVGNKKIVFNPNYVGDHYYDDKWERDILKNRTLHPNGFYIPCKMDYFYTLLYHVTFHPRWKNVTKISDKYKNILMKLGKELNLEKITDATLSDIDYSKRIVELYLEKMSYQRTDTVCYKIKNNEGSRLFKTSIFLLKTHGIKYLLFAIKEKIKFVTGLR